MSTITDEQIDALAAHLCSEFDGDFLPKHKAHWPEDENDNGKREGGYVTIQPKHVQAHARDQAKRFLTFLSDISTPPRPVQEAEPAWRPTRDSLGTYMTVAEEAYSSALAASAATIHQMDPKLIAETVDFIERMTSHGWACDLLEGLLDGLGFNKDFPERGLYASLPVTQTLEG